MHNVKEKQSGVFSAPILQQCLHGAQRYPEHPATAVMAVPQVSSHCCPVAHTVTQTIRSPMHPHFYRTNLDSNVARAKFAHTVAALQHFRRVLAEREKHPRTLRGLEQSESLSHLSSVRAPRLQIWVTHNTALPRIKTVLVSDNPARASRVG